jgi:hypothetical protein
LGKNSALSAAIPQGYRASFPTSDGHRTFWVVTRVSGLSLNLDPTLANRIPEGRMVLLGLVRICFAESR